MMGVSQIVTYPTLIGEMAKRQITKRALARSLGICDKALSNKLQGKAPFTWPEVQKINQCFFPDFDPATLFAKADTSKEVS